MVVNDKFKHECSQVVQCLSTILIAVTGDIFTYAMSVNDTPAVTFDQCGIAREQ